MSKQRCPRKKQYLFMVLSLILFTLISTLYIVTSIDHQISTPNDSANLSSNLPQILPITRSVSYTHINSPNICNGIYFMWDQGSIVIKNQYLQSFGFTTECTKPILKQVLYTFYNYWVMSKKNSTYACLKYNALISSNHKQHIFCNGGRLIHYGGPKIGNKYGLTFFEKHSLNKILTNYCNIFDNKSNNICKFKVLSYNIDNEKQRIEYINKQIDCTNNKSQNDKIWLFKEYKHAGTGIHFYDNHALIYKILWPNITEQNIYYKQCKDIKPFKKTEYFKENNFIYKKIRNKNGNKIGYRIQWERLIMQEFIGNPLLIENKLFHLRCYGLIASWNNPLIILMYRDGTIMRNSMKYNRKDLNPNSLKTNVEFGMNKGAIFKNHWGYKRFQRYLDEIYGEKIANYTENKLVNDVNHIAKTVFSAGIYDSNISIVKQQIFNNNIDIEFHIFCMDMIIDNKFELKLLEVNNYCGFCCDGLMVGNGILCDDFIDNDGFEWVCGGNKHDIFKETIHIMTEIYDKKYYNTLKHIDSLQKFDMVLWQ